MFRLIRSGNCDRDTLVHNIANAAARTTAEQLSHNTSKMSVAELRGYVRARALHAVRAQTFQAVAGRRLQRTKVDDLIAAALERTLHLLIRDFLAPPVATIPTPHVRLRIAS